MLWSRRTCQLLRLGRKAERPVKPKIKIKKATSTLFKKRLEFPELPQTDEIIRTKTTHTRRERSISRLRYQVTDNSRIKNDLHRCRAFVFKAVKRWCNTHKTYHSTQATFPPPPRVKRRRGHRLRFTFGGGVFGYKWIRHAKEVLWVGVSSKMMAPLVN